MKFKQRLLGLALAGAAFLLPANASAQLGNEPYYLTPKLLYNYTAMDDFNTNTDFIGYYLSSGTYRGKDAHDNAFGGGLAAGYDFYSYTGTPVRLELEYLYRGKASTSYANKATSLAANNLQSSSHSLESKVQTLMANIYWDFHNETVFTPYIQAGFGGAYVDTRVKSNMSYRILNNGVYNNLNDSLSGSQNDWNFAWNAGAGFAWQLNDNLALDLSYRYSHFGTSDIGTTPFYIYSNGGNINAYGSGKGSVKLNAHEAILGLRITSF